MNDTMSGRQKELLFARLPIQRQGHVDGIAGAALHLASPLASSVTGQTLAVDGGYTIAMSMSPVFRRRMRDSEAPSPERAWRPPPRAVFA